MVSTISIIIKRYDPDKKKEGYFYKYSIPEQSAYGMTIIDALKYIQENIDPTLSFYYSCEKAKCRGCLVDVDGEAIFACTELVKDGQRIEPLSHLPVVRDLVVRFINSKISIDEELCTACEGCVKACPMDIYEMSESGKTALVKDGSSDGFCGRGDAVDCIGCRRCEVNCPTGAIDVVVLPPK